jgi:hypothetical protein
MTKRGEFVVMVALAITVVIFIVSFANIVGGIYEVLGL